MSGVWAGGCIGRGAVNASWGEEEGKVIGGSKVLTWRCHLVPGDEGRDGASLCGGKWTEKTVVAGQKRKRQSLRGRSGFFVLISFLHKVRTKGISETQKKINTRAKCTCEMYVYSGNYHHFAT